MTRDANIKASLWRDYVAALTYTLHGRRCNNERLCASSLTSVLAISRGISSLAFLSCAPNVVRGREGENQLGQFLGNTSRFYCQNVIKIQESTVCNVHTRVIVETPTCPRAVRIIERSYARHNERLRIIRWLEQISL